MTHQDIAGLVGARICHDLISPIGAIGNGVELLGLTDSGKTPELGLIEDSVSGASAKIKLLRLAFGYAGSDERVSTCDVASILREADHTGRLTYTWRSDQDAPRPEVRCALLAILCLQSAMPIGGEITVDHSAGVWRIEGSSDRLRMESALWAGLTGQGEAETLSPGDVQFALLPASAKALGRQVRAAQRSTGIVISF